MAEYKYVATTIDGKNVKGKTTAFNPEQLKENLKKNNLYLIDYDEVGLKRSRRLKANQVADFCRELSSMLSAGVSLVRSMQIIINRDLPPVMKQTFVSLDRQIKRGVALSEAMESEGDVFPNLLINMVKTGEANGHLDDSLSKMAEYYEARHRTNQEVKSAMTYPIILIVITVVVIIAVFTFIFPTFINVFGDMELPVLTQIMMAISNFFVEQWLLAIVVAVAVAVAIIWLSRLEKVKRWWDKTILRLPKVGKLLTIIYTARFARTFSSLYSSGLSILSALTISKTTVGNKYIESQFDGVIRSVRQGSSLSEALKEVEGFDVKLTDTIAVGEESGRVDELLLKVSESLEYESSAAIKKLIKLIEPIMIMVMAVIILVVMLSVMLPIYQLYDHIEQSNY